MLTGAETEFEGKFGWAKRVPISPDNDNAIFSIASWLIFAPSAHPMWSFHSLEAITLTDLPGRKLAHRQFPEATHEILVLALNPEFQPYTVAEIASAAEQNAGLPYLTPPDVVFQLTAKDHEIERLCAYGARACVDGRLVPDSDYRSHWQRAFTDTLQHLQAGRHG